MNAFDLSQQFPDEQSCIEYVEKLRWKKKPVCPYCGTMRKNWNKRPDGYYNCQQYKCCKSFRVTIGTIFHDTKVPLQKWFYVVPLVVNAKKRISSTQVARDCNLNQKTAWYMMVRIRKAMENKKDNLLKGIVKMDKTYIEGKPRKNNEQIPERYRKEDDYNKRGYGANKKAVEDAVEGGGQVSAESVKKVNKSTLLSKIKRLLT